MTRLKSFESHWLKVWPLLVALLLLLVAIVLPPFDLLRPAHHYQLTFDISQSMNVDDVTDNAKNVTRLALAKENSRKLLRRLPCGSRVGVGVFVGRRIITLINPLEVCEHYAGVLATIDTIDGRMRWMNASSIGKGIHQSLRAAHTIGDNAAVVFFTDGHEAPPLRPGQRGLPKSEGLGVRGLIAGLGGDTPTRIPKMDRQGRITGYWQAEDVVAQPGVTGRPGNEALSKQHSDHLIQLGQLAGLQYLNVTGPASLADVLINADIAERVPVPVNLNWIPAAFALLILCWRFSPAIFSSSGKRLHNGALS